jgi:hypothetical protein
MQDFFEDLYDDQPSEGEPSFSLYEFKKWLSKQKKPKSEVSESKVVKPTEDELKSEFKQRIKNKRKKD